MRPTRRSTLARLPLGAGAGGLAVWFISTHRADLASVEHGLTSTSPWSWLQALALSVVLATSTGGVVRHSLRMTGVPLSLRHATQTSLAGTFLCALIPSGGMAGAPFFAARARRQSAPATAGVAGYFLACIVGRLGLELAVLVSLPLLASCGIPVSLVLLALTVHALSTISKVVVVGACRGREGALLRWTASARSRFGRAPQPAPTCPARGLVEQFAAVRWRGANLRIGLAWSVLGKFTGGLLLVVAVRAVGGSMGWSSGFTIYAAATLVGAASFVPSGLGAVALTIGHSLVATGMAPTQAAAAVVFYRLFQLWIPLLTGGLLVIRHHRPRVRARTTAPHRTYDRYPPHVGLADHRAEEALV